MKILKILPVVIIFIGLFSFTVTAQESSISDEIFDPYCENIFSSLDDETKEILSDFGLETLNTDSIFDLSLTNILSALKSAFRIQIKETSAVFFRMLSCILVLILLNTFVQGKNSELSDDIFSLVIIIFTSSLISDCVKLLSSVFTLTKGFMVSLTPIITVLLSLSGNITFSALYSSAMIGFCQLLSLLADEILVPVTGVYFGLIIAMNFNEVTDAQKLSSHVNNIATSVLGAVSTAFSLLLCAKNLLAKDIDGVLVSSGKYIISSFIPVVGGAVSGILNSVIGSISIVKSTIGIFAVIAFVCINLPLFIKIIFCRIMLGALSAFCDSFSQAKAAKVIKTLSQSIKLMGVLAFFELITVIISTGLAVFIRGNI